MPRYVGPHDVAESAHEDSMRTNLHVELPEAIAVRAVQDGEDEGSVFERAK
jgi:hypothetical protein